MTLATSIAASKKGARMTLAARIPRVGEKVVLLSVVACLALISGCSSVGTVVDRVWQHGRADDSAALGKTLVVALMPKPEVVTALENEWIHQLRRHNVDAHASSVLLPSEIPPEKERVVELVRDGGFNTLLVTRLVDVKHVEREVSSYQVAVVETDLYHTATEQKFWSARADTFLVNPTGERIVELREERVQEFVKTLIGEMSRSNLL